MVEAGVGVSWHHVVSFGDDAPAADEINALAFSLLRPPIAGVTDLVTPCVHLPNTGLDIVAFMLRRASESAMVWQQLLRRRRRVQAMHGPAPRDQHSDHKRYHPVRHTRWPHPAAHASYGSPMRQHPCHCVYQPPAQAHRSKSSCWQTCWKGVACWQRSSLNYLVLLMLVSFLCPLLRNAPIAKMSPENEGRSSSVVIRIIFGPKILICIKN